MKKSTVKSIINSELDMISVTSAKVLDEVILTHNYFNPSANDIKMELRPKIKSAL